MSESSGRIVLRVMSVIGLASSLSGACTTAQVNKERCPPLRASGDWILTMAADGVDYEVNGKIQFQEDTAFAELVATTGEGAGELVEFPIENLRIREDSVFLSFAPIGYRLRGLCLSRKRIEGTFAVPQPPFEDIVGRWSLNR